MTTFTITKTVTVTDEDELRCCAIRIAQSQLVVGALDHYLNAPLSECVRYVAGGGSRIPGCSITTEIF